MKKSILRDEIIGKEVEIACIKGIIIDETRSMVSVRDRQNRIRRFIKKNHIFIIHSDNKAYRIEGKDIVGRPEERIKK